MKDERAWRLEELREEARYRRERRESAGVTQVMLQHPAPARRQIAFSTIVAANPAPYAQAK